MTRKNEFPLNKVNSTSRFFTPGRFFAIRRNKADKTVYNKIQQISSGQTMLSSGEDHPADDLMLTVGDQLFASENGRHMLPLTGGRIKGVSGGLSVNGRILNSPAHSHPSGDAFINCSMKMRHSHHRMITNMLTVMKQSISFHPTFRLAGEQPGSSICRSLGIDYSLPGESSPFVARKSPIICNIVTLSVTGKNFTCGISLI